MSQDQTTLDGAMMSRYYLAMRSWVGAGLLGLLLMSAAMGETTTSAWRDLFAENLKNAAFPKGVWWWENGELTAKEDQMIWTRSDYENFDLELEFKTADGTNSGVIIYVSDPKDWIPNSVEIQIADDFSEQWSQAPKTWQCGALFGRLAATESRVKRPGEWNQMTVIARGQHVRVMLNGTEVVNANLGRWTSATTNPDGSPIPEWLSKPMASLPTKGRIGLQGKHAGAPVWFRNLRVREVSGHE